MKEHQKMINPFASRRQFLPVWPKGWLNFMTVVMTFLAFSMHCADAQMDNTIDPTGGWRNNHGSLSLMPAGDALSFSYSAVFGPAVHICDGAGVAGLVGMGQYRYVDDQGSVAFLVKENEVRMEAVAGTPSFCGANWPGGFFTRDGYEPLEYRRVMTPTSPFYAVMPSPPVERKVYLIAGDRVQTASARHEQANEYVLARFTSPASTTVGLVKISTLEVPN
jgi:hypothetical protein